MNKLTDKEMYFRYEDVRLSGKYNMIKEAGWAAEEADLAFEDYMYVANNYGELRDKYDEDYKLMVAAREEAHQIMEDALSEEPPF